MKLLFLLILVIIISTAVYFISKRKFTSKKKKKPYQNPIFISAVVTVGLLVLIVLGMFRSATQPDMQCFTYHETSSKPPSTLETAKDYFEKGNYEYDTGNCGQAITDYTQAIVRDPHFAQAYNNRAYTNMRLGNYKEALQDLDAAIALNPKYVQALMNRGDIHNYYLIDRKAAIADYRRVISITGPSGGNTSVCGHLFLAKHNGWNFRTVLDMLMGNQYSCKL